MGLNIVYGSGQTAIDEDEKQELIPYWVEDNRDLNMAEQTNINKAILFYSNKKISYRELLTIGSIKKLHTKMLGDVWKWAGRFRRTDKNLGICKMQIVVAIHSLLQDTQYWIENSSYSPAEACIRCKHKMVAIHLFPNGNGRHSRLFADLLMRSLGGEYFTWGESLTNRREQYLESLREADQGNYDALIFFATN